MTSNVETVLPERLAMAAELAPDQLGVPIADIRRRGSGRRRVRTGLTVAAALAGAGGLTAAALVVLPGGASGPQQFGAPPVATGAPGATVPEPCAGRPSGPMLRTGSAYEDGTLVVWVEKPTVYHGKIMVAIAIEHADGSIQRCGEAIDLTGDDLAPGIHEGYNVLTGDPDRAFTLVGYVVGQDVTKLAMTIAGTRYQAQLVAWQTDPRVKIWWLAGPRAVRPNPSVQPTDVLGTDDAGNTVLTADKYPIAAG